MAGKWGGDITLVLREERSPQCPPQLHCGAQGSAKVLLRCPKDSSGCTAVGGGGGGQAHLEHRG